MMKRLHPAYEEVIDNAQTLNIFIQVTSPTDMCVPSCCCRASCSVELLVVLSVRDQHQWDTSRAGLTACGVLDISP